MHDIWNPWHGSLQSAQAAKSGLSHVGKPMNWKLKDLRGWSIPRADLYVPFFGDKCRTCGMQLICNGCSKCGRCGPVFS